MLNKLKSLIILSGVILCVFVIIGNHNIDIQVLADSNIGNGYQNYNIPLADLITRSHINSDRLRIRITKSRYCLDLLYNRMIVKSYPVVFGFNAIDDKLRQGDGCTPEGIFRVRSKYPHAAWSRFIWIDYPNQESWRKYNSALQNGAISVNAGIGGDVGIHGVPKGYDFMIERRQNWTLGCISLKNKDIIEFFPYVNSKTLIEIVR